MEGRTTNPSYDPTTLDITKDEVLDYLNLILIRLRNNPKVSRKVRGKFAADIKLIEWFESEQELKYHIALFLDMTDGIRAIIERKKRPELQRLNALHKEQVIRRIATPPEVVSELDHMKIMAQVRKVMSFGAMRDG